jgi:hypothetical protein
VVRRFNGEKANVLRTIFVLRAEYPENKDEDGSQKVGLFSVKPPYTAGSPRIIRYT